MTLIITLSFIAILGIGGVIAAFNWPTVPTVPTVPTFNPSVLLAVHHAGDSVSSSRWSVRTVLPFINYIVYSSSISGLRPVSTTRCCAIANARHQA